MSDQKTRRQGAPTSTTSGGMTVALRMDFYRDGFRTMLVALPVLLIALLASVILNAYLLTHEKEPRYFVTDPTGRLTPVAPLNVPYISPASLLQWTTQAATASYTFDAENWRKQLQDNARFYTPEGHANYLESMTKQIDFVVKGVMIATAVATGAPVIVGEGQTPQGVYVWKIRLPVRVDYRSLKESATKNLMLTLVVVRRQTIENPEGIGLSQVVAREM